MKYAGLGATVFFTAVFAWMSCAFALNMVFDNMFLAILIGAVWGLMIFNLDRFIVSGMRKESRLWKEFLYAMPRVLLAVLISIVIAKPLELRIFDKEIQPQLTIMEQRVFAEQEEETRKRFAATDSLLKAELSVLSDEVKAKTAARDQLLQIAREEADGTGGSRIRNLGPIYKLKKADADKAEAELRDLTERSKLQMASLLERLDANDSLRTAALNSLGRERRDGLAARIEALDELKEERPPIAIAGLFIMLLFVALECAPVLVKLISRAGPYDELIKTQEFAFRTKATRDRSSLSAEVRTASENWPEEEKTFANKRLDQTLQDSL